MKFLYWFFDHLPFLACVAVGMAAGMQDRTELAVGFFILGSTSEIVGAVTKLHADVKMLKADLDTLREQVS